MIDVKNLTKEFDGQHVLRGIDQHIYPGEKVVVIGPSGSVKSTFLRCLNLLEEPSGGVITLDGEEITSDKVDIDKIRQKMGMVFQQFNLFPHLTIKENIKLAPVTLKLMTEEEADKKALELLERVGLPDKADAYPKQLSGGQQLADDGMTMVVVTHEMGFAREVATRVLFIDEGKIQEDRPPKEFFENPQNERLKEFLSKVL